MCEASSCAAEGLGERGSHFIMWVHIEKGIGSMPSDSSGSTLKRFESIEARLVELEEMIYSLWRHVNTIQAVQATARSEGVIQDRAQDRTYPSLRYCELLKRGNKRAIPESK